MQTEKKIKIKNNPKETLPKTKLYRLLLQRGINQKDLAELIKNRTGMTIQKYRVSKIVNGLIRNYHTDTCRAISRTLGVPMEEILEEND